MGNKINDTTFNIPEPYCLDTWEVVFWDLYQKNIANKKYWHQVSRDTDFDFCFYLCKNQNIKEELKYFVYYMVNEKHVSLYAFAGYYINYKVLSEYVNTYMENSKSILEINDFSVVESFANNYSKENNIKLHHFLNFLKDVNLTLYTYYEKDIPEAQKVIWNCKNFGFCKMEQGNYRLDFRFIKNKNILKNVQNFCLYKLSSIVVSGVRNYLSDLKIFIIWFEGQYSSDFSALNRDIIEKYYEWLKNQDSLSRVRRNIAILNLKVFFDWGVLLDVDNMPSVCFILNSDYKIVRERNPKPLNKEEVVAFLNVLPKMKKIYGKMAYCLLFLGMRFSELARLDVNAIKQNDDGSYYLDLWQFKTQSANTLPVLENIVKIMKNEIEENRQKFGAENVKYVFVNDKNKPVSLDSFNDAIDSVLKKNNVLDRNNEPLHITSHRFRATVATNLVFSGVELDVATQLLGHTSISSLSYYVGVDFEVVKEQLRPRLEKDDMLIRNIGKEKDMAENIPEKSIALCNGYCTKNPLTTSCAKANACLNCSMFIPSVQYLNAYNIQLLEIEATIKLAETNGYTMMLNKALKEKEALEKIIAKLEKGGKENDR